MTPLGASLAFITISVMISIIKYFVFPSTTSNSYQQSEIQLKHLYTISNRLPQKQNKSYSSFYQAYYKFHVEDSHKMFVESTQVNFTEEYNGLVMKKSIINDQQTVICDQNYLITIAEGISCDNKQNQADRCEWKTEFNVYELPLLKEQTKQKIVLEGRIGVSNKQKRKQIINSLQCKKSDKKGSYFLTFSLLKSKNNYIDTQNQDNNQYKFTINILQIIKKSKYSQQQFQAIQNQYKSRRNSQKIKLNKNRNNQPKRYSVPNQSNNEKVKSQKENKTVENDNKSFSIEIYTKQLKNQNHTPQIYTSNGNIIAYSTEQQPWLIRYSFLKSQIETNQSQSTWKQLNILQKSIQDKIYQNIILQSRIPPFIRSPLVSIKYLFAFQTQETTYSDNCLLEQRNGCNQKYNQVRKNYITLVYLHSNSQYRVQRFYVHVTFQINNNLVEQQHKLTSYSMLISQINPSRIIYSDCQIQKDAQKIYQRHFDKYYWLYQNKMIAQLEKYSLLCVFTFDLDEHIRIVEINNIVYSEEKQNRQRIMPFFDWKSLKKIINYKDQFRNQIDDINNLEIVHKNLQSVYYNTINKSQFNQSKSNKSKNQKNQAESKFFKTKFNTQDKEILKYIETIDQQLSQHTLSAKKIEKDKKKNKQTDTVKDKQNKKNDKKTKQEKQQKNQNQKTKKINNKEKSSKNKKKSKSNSKQKQLPQNTTAIKGSYKPTIETSFNYSFYRNVQFPHYSKMNKYKFPLPFLLSFTKNMQIINSDTQKPLILFSGIKQYIFTYTHRNSLTNTTSNNKIVDYRYLILGKQSQQKNYNKNQGQPNNQIETSKTIIKKIEEKKLQQKLNIQIKDQTHPEIQNIFKSIFSADQEILNQIKTIKTIPVETYNKKGKIAQNVENYQRYLIVVWGWGIQVYSIDWDKSGFLRQNITPQEIQEQLSKKSQSLIHYFIPFIQLFATIYCMFQALISSR